MIELLVTFAYIVLCVFFFSLAVAIHEFGHFIVALKLGLKVERFSIGFGPAIWKKTIGDVEYRISLIPFGGYVSIPDVDPEGTKAVQGGSSAEKKVIPPWKEICVAVAGPLMNVVLAVILAVTLSLIPSAKFGVLGTEVGQVIPGGPAEKAGIMKGDKVISINGNKVTTWTEMLVEVQIAGTKASKFEVVRCTNDVCQTLTFEVTPEKDEKTGASYIKIASVSDSNAKAAPWMTDRNPLKQLLNDATGIFRILKGLVTPAEMKTTGAAIGGPVCIAQGIYSSVRHSFADGLGFMRFLNVNLAILNLLPIPVLDGGLILFSLIALIFRRRLPEKFVRGVSMAFMVVLLGLMGILLFRDSIRSYRIHTYKTTQEQKSESLENAVQEDKAGISQEPQK
ncbi:MAG: site-2 protease family protein [Kiritimatiellae bacterium]|nr:site-2 protease family protein [Kiritimatiellia bacterium]